MVNTFITTYPLEEAIVDIDTRRLGKQRVEAQQILTAILNAHAIAKLYDFGECPKGKTPEDDIKREEWYKSVYTRYKTKDKIYRSETTEDYSLLKTEKCSKIVSSGFAMHPMTVMWVGYEDGLRYYINLCILEWIRRGYKNNMKLHVILLESDEELNLPWWIKCKAFHNSNCSALLRKEKYRHESLWYWNIPHIKNIYGTKWYYSGYLWINHLSLEDRLKLYEYTYECQDFKEDYTRMCATINNDFPV